MVETQKKKNKLSITPKKKTTDIEEKRPYDLWADFDQMFSRFRSDIDRLFWSPSSYYSIRPWDVQTPSTDIADHGDRYEVLADLPGVKKDDVDIQVTPNSIEISAEYGEDTEEKNKNWLRRERRSMNYYRAFDLPEEIKSDQVEAELKEGVLTISLPKIKPSKEQQVKKVDIK